MISEQTIRTVISICQGFRVEGDSFLHRSFAGGINNVPQYALDALAAEAVRQIPYAVTIGPTYIGIRDTKEIGLPVIFERTFIGDRTINTLNAIAEFVNKSEVFKDD